MIAVNIDETLKEQIVAGGQDFYRVNKIPGSALDSQISAFQVEIDNKNQEIAALNKEIASLQNIKLLIPSQTGDVA